ncbi:MAG: hypothetical protein NTV33_04640 [Coprothermobacterota bacterium]|nr:hypothetical protein [Coprothermobacterota bacterium]
MNGAEIAPSLASNARLRKAGAGLLEEGRRVWVHLASACLKEEVRFLIRQWLPVDGRSSVSLGSRGEASREVRGAGYPP